VYQIRTVVELQKNKCRGRNPRRESGDAEGVGCWEGVSSSLHGEGFGEGAGCGLPQKIFFNFRHKMLIDYWFVGGSLPVPSSPRSPPLPSALK